MQLSLQRDEDLKAILEQTAPEERSPEWISELTEFLKFVQEADLETRKTPKFQYQLWEENAVSGVGMGTVDISAALDSSEFCNWMGEQSLQPVPDQLERRLAYYKELYDQIITKLSEFSNRVPYVKIFRVLAALYPRDFSTITNVQMALECHRAWFGKRRPAPDRITRQVEIMQKLQQLLGTCADSPNALAARMTLPWLVYQTHVQGGGAEAVTETATDRGDVKLKPLPARQRRKGITSIRGGLDTLVKALSFVQEGVSREELLDFLKTEFPDYRDSSLRTLINVLKNEFYVIGERDGTFTPTARGELYLESEDPQELIPLLITRTLGVDHILCALKESPLSSTELTKLLQKVNPGWTSNFAPGAMLRWLRYFDLVEVNNEGLYALTGSGRTWTEAIHWTPEFLEPEPSEDAIQVPLDGSGQLNILSVDQNKVFNSTIEGTAFGDAQVSQLHYGLWSHERRHFAILAGLSGSGKTWLAQRYAAALTREFGVPPEQFVFMQAVQPGWYDPSPLFGYVNPLQKDSYERSPLLDFVLRAVGQPDLPFIVILDEMNLSHPEQYFAPVLSAMESAEPLRLHNAGSVFDGVPMTVPYPANMAFIGTVNMDETTHGISDKVLDRAFTLEFWDIDLSAYPRWNEFGLDPEYVVKARSCLSDLLETLAPERLHFGWRIVEDVLGYLSVAVQGPDFNFTEALDDVVYARVLPKLRGSESERLHTALEQAIKLLSDHGLSRSRKKVQTLKQDLSDTGMMRFWR